MKRLFTLVLFSLPLICHAQPPWGYSGGTFFDVIDTTYNYIYIDTINYPNNKWQIGKPHKVVFNSALSFPSAIVTDTLNTYPPNDTSVFILKLLSKQPYYSGSTYIGPLFHLDFYYKLDIDTDAVAKLEISIDSGVHWIDTKDSLPTGFSWEAVDTPNFAISTIEWKQCVLNIPYGYGCSDTVLFRFTYTSDSVISTKEGWMIDNIRTWYWFESASNIQNNKLISIYPNPSKGDIQIRYNTPRKQNAVISVYNILGQEVYKTDRVPPDGNLHLQLPDGIYTLKYLAGDEYCVRRVVIAN